MAMRNKSTIEEVIAAEARVKNVLEALKKADPEDQHLQDRLAHELKSATDGYSRTFLALVRNSPLSRVSELWERQHRVACFVDVPAVDSGATPRKQSRMEPAHRRWLTPTV